jgi:hypothetical protein
MSVPIIQVIMVNVDIAERAGPRTRTRPERLVY